jgi:hypothetical protein
VLRLGCPNGLLGLLPVWVMLGLRLQQPPEQLEMT